MTSDDELESYYHASARSPQPQRHNSAGSPVVLPLGVLLPAEARAA